MTSPLIPLLTPFALQLIFSVLNKGRDALVALPSRVKATHLKKVIFIGSLGALVPLMFMSLESLGCILEVPGLLDVRRPPNPTKKDRFHDIIWER